MFRIIFVIIEIDPEMAINTYDHIWYVWTFTAYLTHNFAKYQYFA